MQRREFITLLGSAAAAWPLAARAQQPATLKTIGFLGASTSAVMSQWSTAFVQRLRELGWIEGHNIAIEYRWGEGRFERFTEIAAEFVRLKVDIIVASGTAVLAAKEASSVIPIVFPVASDAIGAGFVASLARPGGNMTGLTLQSSDLAGKRLEILREIIPRLPTLAVLANVGNPGAVPELREIQALARTLGLDVISLEIQRAEDLAPAFEALRGRAEALYVVNEAMVSTNRVRINTLALGARLPTMHGFREYVEAGGLMSYGPNLPDLFRRAADIADKILHGTKPGDIPVEQPTKFDLVINLTTAKALRLTIPEAFLLRADEVIERILRCSKSSVIESAADNLCSRRVRLSMTVQRG
jgi:putative ABC transport system substrate-binding protein